MTARQVWEAALTELSKVNAPSLLLHEFNYYINKAIAQYINKRYNIYDVNQQTTDDLRVLKATAILDADESKLYSDLADFGAGAAKLFGATYEVTLPDDYLHMLNCICIYKMLKSHRCYDKDNYVQFAAKRLTADAWSVIVNDYYNRPLPERPYYYIHNVNNSTDELTPTNTVTDLTKPYNVSPTKVDTKITYYNNGTQVYVKDGKVYSDTAYTIQLTNLKLEDLRIQTITNQTKGETNDSNFPRVISLNSNFEGKSSANAVERETGQRYGNSSKVRCEIRYGYDNSVYQLEKVLIDYIKAPQTIRLTKAQVDLTADTSQIMEFPDYVCQEIINELVILIMQRDADPRLQTQAAVSQSIANPAQQQTRQPQLQGG